MIPLWKAVSAVMLVGLSTSLVAAQAPDYLGLAPLKQIKSGIGLSDISCKQGFQLILKSENYYPACVKPQTAQELLQRGWAIAISSQGPNTHAKTDFAPARQTYPITSSPQITVTRIFSTMPGMVKIVSIETSPTILKVGDQAIFSVTFQNISNRPIYLHGNCASPPFSYTVVHTSNLIQYPSTRLGCQTWAAEIKPNQMYTIPGVTNSLLGYYKMADVGVSTVNAKLSLFDDYSGKEIVDTIQFDLIVTDSGIPNHQT